MMLSIILVFLGGAIGSIWRYWWSGFVAERFGEVFPFGTLVVNLTGSTIIGAFSGLLAHVSNSSIATPLQQLLVVGVCGGLTTFLLLAYKRGTYSLMGDGSPLWSILSVQPDFAYCVLRSVGRWCKGLNF